MSSSVPGNNNPLRSHAAPLWQKPLAWLGALVLAAMGAWLTETFTGSLSAIFDPDRYGDPVNVHVVMQPAGNGVSLPPGVQVGKEDQAKIHPQGAQHQAALYAARGGIVIGAPSLQVVITGKRPEPVRVIDIQDASECTSPQRGTLVWLSPPFRGQIDDSIRLGITVGEPDQHVYAMDSASDSRQPYFPGKTITLQKGESHLLEINLESPAGQVCRPQLEMTVIDGINTHRQQLVPEEQRVEIMNEVPENDRDYQQVYLWGYICDELTPAPVNWQDSRSRCGTTG
jgi:hypothetical protein